jgi:hypothetical protein
MFSLFQEVLSTSVVLNDNIVCGSPAEAVQLCLHCLQDVSTSIISDIGPLFLSNGEIRGHSPT